MDIHSEQLAYWYLRLNGFQKLFAAMKAKALPIPPFWPERGMNFFPLHCLSAPRAAWAVRTSVALVTSVYESLGVQSPLAGYPPESFSVDA